MTFKKIFALATCAAGLMAFAQPAQAASAAGVVTVNYHTPIAVWREPGRSVIKGKTLANNTAWRYFKTTNYGGQTWYNLGGQQWVPASYVTVGTNSGIAQITKAVNIYAAPNSQKTSRVLPFNSRWRYFSTRLVNNQWWYNLGGSQWVPQSAVNAGQDPQISHAPVPVPAGSVVTVTNPHGARVISFDLYLQKFTGKVLPYGTRWRAFPGINHGVPTIGVGGNQFVYSTDVALNK